ncbi:hypothetical protein [Nibrella saemangeumensis]
MKVAAGRNRLNFEKVALPNKAPGLLIVQLRTGNKLVAKKVVVVR